MTFLVIIGSIFLIWLIVANINSYNEGKRQMRESAWLKQIKEKYPEAYNEYFTWEARKRAARTGRNPQTGKEIKIAAKTVPAFSAGKKFKELVK